MATAQKVINKLLKTIKSKTLRPFVTILARFFCKLNFFKDHRVVFLQRQF
ncbi:hypothetical protein NIASO_11100 [Niabella soli DSM 19437]|uniref:Uncharacterized protein n=1 Tax=Niabella soli DSM 19437 TaxID=929713 RepID=W0F8B2_9BACT|nr:hypothetical protein NIASO_11100 [Niabella soli DSM 19437]